MAMKPESKKYYVAPITLGFTPSDGDLIGGTINGVEVNGRWIGESKGVILYRGGNADTYKAGNTNVPFCSIVFRNEKAVISLEQDSAPTTDYELHLYRYVPSDIVQIPQMYVEGLEETTANANQALENAATAQSTANAAQSTADEALSTANASLMVYGKSTETTVTIESLGSSGTTANLKNLGALNIENGSRISLAASDSYRDEGVWNGHKYTFNLNVGAGIRALVDLTLLPNGNVQIYNHSGINFTNVVITYHKIEVRNACYDTTSGVWLPPYLCYSCIYLVSSKLTNNGYPVYKITVDDTGTLKATEVT